MHETAMCDGCDRDDVHARILEAAKALLSLGPETKDPTVPPFDAFWTRAHRGFYAVKVIDCRAAAADETVTWAANQARQPMLNAAGWEVRLKVVGDPELIIILLLNELRSPAMVKLHFEAETKKMVKPTRSRVWVTTDGFVATARPESPLDVFVICDC